MLLILSILCDIMLHDGIGWCKLIIVAYVACASLMYPCCIHMPFSQPISNMDEKLKVHPQSNVHDFPMRKIEKYIHTQMFIITDIANVYYIVIFCLRYIK